MVTKEQRRGSVMDMTELRNYAIKYYYETKEGLPKGMIAIRFGWGYSKIWNLMKMVSEAFDDIQLLGGTLFFLGPYDPEEIQDDN